MGRAPCCEKIGLKKGPWTREEDQTLINFISLNGHANWRAVPKLAGLLRCGKSCRLRWINYLRPDLKRGNYTAEEEETIINLHAAMGNRWSAIAAKLPGRTDNEIKNVWHTHLKKRVNKIGKAPRTIQEELIDLPDELEQQLEHEEEQKEDESSRPANISTSPTLDHPVDSPQNSFSDISSYATATSDSDNTCMNFDTLLEDFPEVDEGFLSEVLSDEMLGRTVQEVVHGDMNQLPTSKLDGVENESGDNWNMCEDMHFWSALQELEMHLNSHIPELH